MLRLVALAIGLVILTLLLIKLGREARTMTIDWTGITFACGFIIMAFYLRDVTGLTY